MGWYWCCAEPLIVVMIILTAMLLAPVLNIFEVELQRLQQREQLQKEIPDIFTP